MSTKFASRAAIWRFKEENRALMRRLYGDLESNSVYREMRSTNGGTSMSGGGATSSPPGLHNLPSEEHSIFSSLDGYNIRVGSGLATVQSAREPVSDIRILSGTCIPCVIDTAVKCSDNDIPHACTVYVPNYLASSCSIPIMM